MKLTSILFSLLGPSLTAALSSVGPDYKTPSVPTPSAFHDTADDNAWKVGAPNDAASRGEWWTLFADPALNALESRALASNQDLRAAVARVEQARAIAGLTRSGFWPQIGFAPSIDRGRTSATIANLAPQTVSTTEQVSLNASWEIDLFGRVRRLNESTRADAEASAAMFESVRLSLTSDVANGYFSLRAIDRELAILQQAFGLRQRELDLVRARWQSGGAAELDVARAETELASVETEAATLAAQRASSQNALAVLLGAPAPDFSLTTDYRADVFPPTVPAGLPAGLLERRPDIAAAERTLAANNARIGVAKAAFFPSISLTAGAGYASADMSNLLKTDSRIWSIGPSLYLPIFQGGRNKANLARSRAAYDESIALFRQRVLVAFSEVQDALTATRLLAVESAAQDRGLVSARRAASLAQTRYDAGYVTYFEVIDAQRTVLSLEQSSAQLSARRLNNSVKLIKSLGGAWAPSPAVASLP